MKVYLIKYRDSKFRVKARDEVEAVERVSSYVSARDAGMISGLINKAENLVSGGKEILGKGSLGKEALKALGIIGLDIYLVGKELTDLVKNSAKI